MSRRFIIAGLAALALSSVASAQDVSDNAPVVITSPASWATMRSDSIALSIQADPVLLPTGSVDIKVNRRSGNRTTVLFTRNVKVEEGSAEVFLGRSRDVPLGGTDFLSIEWSVPQTDYKGTVEPVGIAKLSGKVVDNKWVPARPPLTAVRLEADLSDTAAAAARAGSQNTFDAGGAKFAAGWNAEKFYILFTPAQSVTAVEVALDLKCGKNAFLSRADRFIRYSVTGDSVFARHYNRAVGTTGITYEELVWGSARSLTALRAEGTARLITVQWSELGIQPFEERNIGISVYVDTRGKRQPVTYPPAAVRNIPGTWGDITLAK